MVRLELLGIMYLSKDQNHQIRTWNFNFFYCCHSILTIPLNYVFVLWFDILGNFQVIYTILKFAPIHIDSLGFYIEIEQQKHVHVQALHTFNLKRFFFSVELLAIWSSYTDQDHSIDKLMFCNIKQIRSNEI